MSTKKVEIDTKELVKIIKACRLAGVKELKVGELELRFGTGEAAEPQVLARENVRPPTDKELKAIEARLEEKDILDRADEELAHMQVEDPLQFEELLIQRELEPSGQGPDEIALD